MASKVVVRRETLCPLSSSPIHSSLWCVSLGSVVVDGRSFGTFLPFCGSWTPLYSVCVRSCHWVTKLEGLLGQAAQWRTAPRFSTSGPS